MTAQVSAVVACTAAADDHGMLALRDVATVAGDTEYRVIGGHMVRLLRHVYNVPGTPRITSDADTGIDVKVASDGGFHDRLTAMGYLPEWSNRYVRGEQAIDLLVPAAAKPGAQQIGGRQFMGETASKLRVVFESAEQHRGVYLFDEFDALGADRAGNDVGEARRILNSFLVFLENSGSESLIVTATNHRTILDRALFRRFDMVLAYALPDAKQGAAVLRARLGSMAKGIRWGGLASEMVGLSHADLVRAAEAAAKTVILSQRSTVTIDDLRVALEARRVASFG